MGEALTNAVKHARAVHIQIELSFERERVRLRVTDDGCGFDPQAMTSQNGDRFGLLGMRERADQVGGELKVESAPGEGTEVSVAVSC